MGVHAVSFNHPISPEIFCQTTSNLTQFPYIKPAWLIWIHFFKHRKNGCAGWLEKIPKFTRFSPGQEGQKQGWKTGVCIAWISTRSHPFLWGVWRAKKWVDPWEQKLIQNEPIKNLQNLHKTYASIPPPFPHPNPPDRSRAAPDSTQYSKWHRLSNFESIDAVMAFICLYCKWLIFD